LALRRPQFLPPVAPRAQAEVEAEVVRADPAQPDLVAQPDVAVRQEEREEVAAAVVRLQ
jgi:hypothetical protein